jgi:hypothetical protein
MDVLIHALSSRLREAVNPSAGRTLQEHPIKGVTPMKRSPFEPSGYGIASMSARDVLGANLKALMEASTEYKSTLALEKATLHKGCKVGKSTIDRAIRGETTLNLDYIEVIAKVFGLDPWQLLTPGLQPNNAPVIRSIGEAEDQMYLKLKGLAKEIASLSEN